MRKHPGIFGIMALAAVLLTGVVFTPHSGFGTSSYTAEPQVQSPGNDGGGWFWQCGKMEGMTYHRGRMGLPEANGGWGDRQCKVSTGENKS